MGVVVSSLLNLYCIVVVFGEEAEGPCLVKEHVFSYVCMPHHIRKSPKGFCA